MALAAGSAFTLRVSPHIVPKCTQSSSQLCCLLLDNCVDQSADSLFSELPGEGSDGLATFPTKPPLIHCLNTAFNPRPLIIGNSCDEAIEQATDLLEQLRELETLLEGEQEKWQLRLAEDAKKADLEAGSTSPTAASPVRSQ